MTNAPRAHEQERLDALRALEILDTPPEEAFDTLVDLAQRITACPIALVSLVDDGRQWFKARVGLDVEATPREVSFCRYVVESDEELVVPDANDDPRFTARHPLVAGPPNVRFYAGFPLRTEARYVVGTLCVIDRVPRTLTESELGSMRSLARQASLVLEHRRALFEIDNRARVEARIVAMLTHELRTPLTSIQASLRMLSSGVGGEVDDRAKDMLRLADRNAQRLGRLVDDFLELSKIAADKLVLDRTNVDLTALLDEAITADAPYADRHNVELGREGTNVPCTVLVDAHRIRQVLDNLVSNACKFATKSVTVGLLDDGETGFFVRDDGPGIAPEFRDELFGRFTQHGGSKGGSGLGLHVAMRIVNLHGGAIDFVCPESGGTIFRVSLPRGAASTDADER